MSFDIRDEDVYWCTADIGWVTGHSYIVYGPLAWALPRSCLKAFPTIRSLTGSGVVERYGVNVFLHAPTSHSVYHEERRRLAEQEEPQQPETAWHRG